MADLPGILWRVSSSIILLLPFAFCNNPVWRIANHSMADFPSTIILQIRISGDEVICRIARLCMPCWASRSFYRNRRPFCTTLLAGSHDLVGRIEPSSDIVSKSAHFVYGLVVRVTGSRRTGWNNVNIVAQTIGFVYGLVVLVTIPGGTSFGYFLYFTVSHSGCVHPRRVHFS